MKLIFTIKQFIVFILQMTALFSFNTHLSFTQDTALSMVIVGVLLASLVANIVWAVSSKNNYKQNNQTKNFSTDFINRSAYLPNYNH